MKTFYIKTLGCKVNQYESDGIAAGLENNGLVQAQKGRFCDLCIINTCAVTSKAAMQSRQAVRKLARDNPGAKIIVTGCHAQTDPDIIKNIDYPLEIVCHRDKAGLADHIVKDPSPFPMAFKPADHSAGNRFHNFTRPVTGSMTRAYLKIQDGCDAFCTYCIVPYARGSSVSMPVHMVLHHLEALGKAGFKEVILTGIHAGRYGRDLTPPSRLTNLMETIREKKPVHRIRLSSIEPNEIDDRFLDLAGPGNLLCDHFHVPLQSGDDQILKKMKRPYTTRFFKEIICRIHDRLPFAGIGVDILTGFPTETDQQFENTYALIKQLPVSYLHVFPFSPRKSTPAFSLKPRVQDAVIQERCRRMRALGRQKQVEFIRANQGRRLEAVVQSRSNATAGTIKAVTSNYLTVLLEKNNALKGKITDVVYDQWDSNLNIFGELCNGKCI
ncbi:MAG: tRNA (N(6)-L-threonylcarbamoyladenosine(37)-C(2))-methylthiotransferase MtaB [Desulfotignum sp.]|nr:tRNA (N(6)-L-threonylcarbamoyladenosine(37)-C(2))-methylthiotransferase MtaB [Desulfotignum sp.]MCF8124738.1 tRNA (N(6)-L-threonylcarbamoyladenosine(37)-C(2))-methylthiotransferase MtaB [Desulfotignum sp.]